MHDPMTVAIEIRRPWPKRDRFHDAKPGKPRWEVGGPFWRLAGKGFYFPGLVTIWHVEPGGADSGDVCPQHVRWQDEMGKWHLKGLHAWKFHVRHWRLQVHPLQNWRRKHITRCEECGRKGSPNRSFGGPRPKRPFFRSPAGLYHSECMDLVFLRRQREIDEVLIRILSDFAPNRADIETSLPDFAHRYRLQRVLGEAE